MRQYPPIDPSRPHIWALLIREYFRKDRWEWLVVSVVDSFEGVANQTFMTFKKNGERQS
jgi:hypothetical protein